MLEGIRNNIEKLIALYESEKKQNEKLVLELEQKDATIDSCKKQIAELERQVDNLKLQKPSPHRQERTMMRGRR